MAVVTWNPADKHANIILSEGDLRATCNAGGRRAARATESKAADKWYWEIKYVVFNSSREHGYGIGTSAHDLTAYPGDQLGTTVGYGYYEDGTKINNTSYTAYGDSFGLNDIIGIAIDLTAGKIWFAKNNVWQALGDPAAGTNPAFTGLSGTYFPFLCLDYLASGKARFAVADFTYSPPSGFSSLEGGETGTNLLDGKLRVKNVVTKVFDGKTQLSDNDINIFDGKTEVDILADARILDGKVVVENTAIKFFNGKVEVAGLSTELFDGKVEVAGLTADLFDGKVGVKNLSTFLFNGKLHIVKSVSKLFDGKLAIEYVPVNYFDGKVIIEGPEVVNLLDGKACLKGFAINLLDGRLAIPDAITLVVEDSIFVWEALVWGWDKSIADSMSIADSVEKILGIPVSEFLTLVDSQVTQWKGVEVIADNLFLVDIPKVVEIFDDLIADGVTVVDAIRIALELLITDILICTDSIVDVGKFQFSATETLTLEDIVSRAWEKTAADALTATDSNILLYLALPQIADAFGITEAITPGLTINQAIADALQVLDTASLQQIVQELIADGLALDIQVELNDELWECWVLNTAAFHPSVYSGYGYNSFAIDKINNTVYGCRADGIYELTGSTDDGTPFHSGIVLPDTTFGLSNKKKFRKAMMGVSGNNLVMKVETESGSKTFTMTNARVDITRDLRGRSWKFSLEDFDELDFLELYPVILSKK